MAAMKAFGEQEEAPALDLTLGLNGGNNNQQRAFIGFLNGLSAQLSPVIDALEQDGDETTTRLAQVLAPARNNIDAAVFLLVAGGDQS
jgi:hypothetical protein